MRSTRSLITSLIWTGILITPTAAFADGSNFAASPGPSCPSNSTTVGPGVNGSTMCQCNSGYWPTVSDIPSSPGTFCLGNGSGGGSGGSGGSDGSGPDKCDMSNQPSCTFGPDWLHNQWLTPSGQASNCTWEQYQAYYWSVTNPGAQFGSCIPEPPSCEQLGTCNPLLPPPTPSGGSGSGGSGSSVTQTPQQPCVTTMQWNWHTYDKDPADVLNTADHEWICELDWSTADLDYFDNQNYSGNGRELWDSRVGHFVSEAECEAKAHSEHRGECPIFDSYFTGADGVKQGPFHP